MATKTTRKKDGSSYDNVQLGFLFSRGSVCNSPTPWWVDVGGFVVLIVTETCGKLWRRSPMKALDAFDRQTLLVWMSNHESRETAFWQSASELTGRRVPDVGEKRQFADQNLTSLRSSLESRSAIASICCPELTSIMLPSSSATAFLLNNDGSIPKRQSYTNSANPGASVSGRMEDGSNSTS